jgi:hypothetical protein
VGNIDILRASRRASLTRQAVPNCIALHRLIGKAKLNIPHKLRRRLIHTFPVRTPRRTLLALVAEIYILAAPPFDLIGELTVHYQIVFTFYFHLSNFL